MIEGDPQHRVDDTAQKDRQLQASEHAPELAHIDDHGEARMVDITSKPESKRTAVARGRVMMQRATLELVDKEALPKGDVFTVARIAGIMAAKRTADVIPMCHPVPVTGIDVRLWPSWDPCAIEIEATVTTKAATGVEMEALNAVSAAALTVYDMCKSAERGMKIDGVRLVKKTGGVRGDYIRDDEGV